MREIFGKKVLDSLQEIVDPAHTALIVVDMQNDFCSPNGLFAQAGADVSMLVDLIPHLRAFVEATRQAGVKVIHTQNTTLPNGASDSPAWIRAKAKFGIYTLEGTWGQAFCPGMEPRPDDVVIKKHRSSAFVNTDIDLVLRANGIQSIIVTGCLTNGCVLGTANHGRFLDYYVVVPRDCVGSTDRDLHEAALKLMGTVRSDEILAAWAAPKSQSVAPSTLEARPAAGVASP